MALYDPKNRQPTFQTPGNSKRPPEFAKSNLSRILPRQMSTGTLRGTQNVGYGNVKIDGSNNRISINANDTLLNIGDVSSTDDITGVSLINPANNQPLATIGREGGENPTSGLTVYDGTNTRRLLGGQFPDGSVKIKLSQEGHDVATATDDQLIWSSDFNLFKIVKSGTADSVVSSLAENATDTRTIVHGFGRVPAAIVYINGTGSNYLVSGRYYPTPTAISVKVGANYQPGIVFDYQVDDTNLYLTVTNKTPVTPVTDIGTVNWKYFLLLETAS